MDEVFVEIPGFPNYVVSNYGRIVNVKFDRDVTQTMTRSGNSLKVYAKVSLYRNGKAHSFSVHRVVAQAFFLNYQEGIEVLHESDDYSDNSVTNLHIGWERVRVRETPIG
jgi:NUMOD4 motif